MRLKPLAILSAPLLAAALSVAPALAHHSGAMFDRSKTVKVDGTVKSFGWSNPHAWVELEVRGATGVDVWNLEGGSPTVMVKDGWKKSSLKPGDKVSLIVHPMRDGSKGGTLVGAILPDGTRLGPMP